MPTFVSLFAGIGGFDLALERHGWTPTGQCEIDPHARSVLDRAWPDTPKHDDVTTLTPEHFAPPDLVTFGSPCQDLSVAGKRAGMAGERSGLFAEAVRYIRDLQEATNDRYPTAALWENVPGAFWSNGGADFAAVLESLVGGPIGAPADGWKAAGVAFGPLGTAEWRTLDAQYFGLAQRRERIFLVYRPRGDRAGQVLLEQQGVRGHPRAGRETRPDHTGALTLGLGSGGPDLSHAEAGWLQPVAHPVTTRSRHDASTDTLLPVSFNWQNWTVDGVKPEADRSGPLVGSQTKAVAFAMRGRDAGNVPEVSGDKTSALRGAAGGSTRDLIAFDLAQITHPENRSRPQPGKPNGTIGASSSPHVATGYAVRRLTPRECERLQGFPDDHTRHAPDGSEIADTNRYRMIGNAVAVPVVEWIARRLNATLDF